MARVRPWAACAVLTLALGVSACAGTAAGDTKDGTTTLTLASITDNNSFDPAALEIGNRVQYWMPVFDTLLVLDESSVPQPNLASEWSYNADATVLNLKLRHDVAFTDGTPLDAAAVKTNMEHLAHGGGQNAYMAASIADYEIINDHELNLILSAPDPALVGYLGVVGGAMASPASLTAPDVATHPVGSGPYVLDQQRSTSGAQYVYTRNDDYWNTDAFPYDELIIKPMYESSARLNALKSGQIDAALGSPALAAEAEASGLRAHTTQVDWLGLFIADRNGTRVPALGDVRVRQAINMAIDGAALLKGVELGKGETTDQIFNPTALAFDASLDNAYPYDPAAARALLSDAGYAGGFTVTMPSVSSFDSLNPIVEQFLADVNISIDWVVEAPESAITALLSQKYPMFFFQLGSQSSWQDIQKSVLPSSPWNPFQVEDAALTELVTAAQFAVGPSHEDALHEVNRWLVENAWFDPWYREDSVYLTDSDTEVVMQSQNVVPWIRGFTPVK